MARAKGLKAVASKRRESAARALRRELDQLRTQMAALETADKHRLAYGLERGAPSITRRGLDRALLERLRQREADVEQALTGLGDFARGVCARCGGLIHPDRMAVLPGTRLCIRCAKEAEAESKPRRRGQ